MSGPDGGEARLREDVVLLREGLARASGSKETRGLALRLSETLEREGKLEQAVRILQALAAASPQDPELRLSLGRLLQRSGRNEEAMRLFAGPQATERSLVEGARLLINQGRFEEADAVMADATARAPRDYDVVLTLGRLRRWQHRLEEAVAAYREAIALRPEVGEPHLFLAESLMRLGRLDDMFAALREGSRSAASNGIPALLDHYRLATLSLDYEKAATLAESVLDATRTTWELEPLLWLVFTDEFDFTERPLPYVRRALEAIERFISAHPELPWGYYWRGLMRELDPSMRPQAASDFARMPDYAAARYGWMRYKSGLARLYAGELDHAAEEFRVVASASRPGNWKAQCFLSETLLFKGDRAGSVAAYADVERLAPGREVAGADPGECLALKGKLQLWTRDLDGALESLDAALQHATYDAQCWKGGALVCLGRFEEALPWLERAVSFRFTPTYAEARVWRAEAFYRLKRWKEALAEAEAAIAVESTDFYPYVIRGLARGALGDAAGMAQDAGRLPKEVAAYAAARLSAGSGPAAILESVLRCSGGFRCYHPMRPFELKVWMH